MKKIYYNIFLTMMFVLAVLLVSTTYVRASAPLCGNGVKDPGEICDSTSSTNTLPCTVSSGFGAATYTGVEHCLSTCTDWDNICVPTQRCGDNAINGGEYCDSSKLNGHTCDDVSGLAGQGYTGTPVCNSVCSGVDKGSCQKCGNGIAEGTEQCDGTDIRGKTCTDVLGVPGFTGTPGCQVGSCTLNFGTCQKCGDNVIMGNEVCDGTALNGKTCADVSGLDASYTGTPGCPDCTSITKGSCQKCGNGLVEGTEVCEVGQTQSCTKTVGTITYTGTESCKTYCTGWNTCDIGAQRCGDSTVNGNEECDAGANNGKVCSTTGYGTSCTYCDTSCNLQTVRAPYCGDGIITKPNEQCDGSHMGTIPPSCSPFTSGTVTCGDDCQYSYADCYTCGDGIIQSAEECDKGGIGGASSNIGSNTCNSVLGGTDWTGTPVCGSSCMFLSKGSCQKCGNDIAEGTEVCDGTDLKGQTCATQLGAGFVGTPNCNSACSAFDTSLCYKCGDGTIQGPEVCDGSNLNGHTCADVSGLDASYTGTPTCNSCMSLSKGSCQKCGNGLVEGTEVCDGSNLNGHTCADVSGLDASYTGTPTCNSCMSLSKGSCQKCGDNTIEGSEVCDGSDVGGKTCVDVLGPGYFGTLGCKGTCGAYETSGCYHVNGWTPMTGGWSVVANTGFMSVQGNNQLVKTDAFDLKAGQQYSLSADIFMPSGTCDLTLSLDSSCTNATDWTDNVCFDNSQTKISLSSTSGWTHVSKLFIISANPAAVNGKYFRDAKLQIFTGNCANVAQITNVSLRENTYYTDNVHYDTLPQTVQYTAGCCPNSYCWNGSACLDSDAWMNNASYDPIWNNLFVDTTWLNNHVNTSAQPSATGYRCVVVNQTTKEAEWIPSSIKYDWNYENSGYCAQATDCFVNNTAISRSTSAYSFGCIHDGDTVSDTYVLGTGNHYCYQGNWTTKSYIIATLLQNLSQGKSFILSCDQDPGLLYNKWPTPSHILSACTIILKAGTNNEQVITAIALNNTNPSITASNLLADIKTQYTSTYLAPQYPANPSIQTNLAACSVIPGSDFKQCDNGGVVNIKIYYNTKYDYAVISDRNILGLSTETFVGSILTAVSNFFTKLFATSQSYGTEYTSTNYTSSYDRIYILTNSTLNARGIEESKYDESQGKILTVLYIHYNGTNSTKNSINIADVFNAANQSNVVLGGSYFNMNSTLNNESYQEVIIKTDNPTGLWQYFTTILRDRPPGPK